MGKNYWGDLGKEARLMMRLREGRSRGRERMKDRKIGLDG